MRFLLAFGVVSFEGELGKEGAVVVIGDDSGDCTSGLAGSAMCKFCIPLMVGSGLFVPRSPYDFVVAAGSEACCDGVEVPDDEEEMFMLDGLDDVSGESDSRSFSVVYDEREFDENKEDSLLRPLPLGSALVRPRYPGLASHTMAACVFHHPALALRI